MHSLPQPAAQTLAGQAADALVAGISTCAAELAGAAAAAFLIEQGEPSFDAPNMLRLRAEAQLALADHAGAGETLDRAETLAEPLPRGVPFDRLRVHLGRLRGETLLAAGDRPGARLALEAALAHCEATLDREDDDAAALHNGLGVVAKFAGRFDDAEAHYRRAGELLRAADAPASVLAGLHHNLGGLAHSRGDLVTAEQETRRALELHTARDGPAAASTAADRGQWAGVLSELGRHEEAERELRRTLADTTALHGPDHLEVAIARTTLGAALHRAGRLGEADALYRDGLTLRERLQGAGHPEHAPTLLYLSALSEQHGDRDGAVSFAQRANASLEGTEADDHPVLVAARARLVELAR